MYAGIDEAGYGPVLGPLCVGMSVIEVSDWTPGGRAPDLWSRLKGAVGRTATDARAGKIPVNDSKKLKLANSSVTRHPLTYLERGVLPFIALASSHVDTDHALYQAIGCRTPEPMWYEGDALALPIATTQDAIRLSTAKLARVAEDAGIVVREMRCIAVDELAFNQRLDETGSKAAVSFDAVAALIRRVWKSSACAEAGNSDAAPRVIVDRQGGRQSYSAQLARAMPDANVTILDETETLSRYELVSRDSSTSRCMRVQFQVEAEERHMPVALASMIAKFVRELTMARLNRYWSQRVAELKPTAGYYADGMRWLSDIAAHATPQELAMLRRRA